MKRILLIALLVSSAYLLMGSTWIRSADFTGICPWTYDGSRLELCNIIPAIGGGYLLQGYASYGWIGTPIYDTNVFWKLDENGDLIWRRTGGQSGAFDSIVSNGIDRYYCVQYFYNGSRLFVFDSEMNTLGYYVFPLVNGYSPHIFDMQYVDDGLICAGKVNGQAVVLKTDFQFNLIWQSDPFWAVGQARSVEPFGNGWVSLSSRVFTEINAVGDTLWTYYDTINNTGFYDCTVAADNSIYLLGLYKIWKVDIIEHTLDLVAANTPGFDSDLHGAINLLPNGNIVYTGGRPDTGPILHSYNPDGTLQWSRSYNTFGAIYFGTGSKNLLVMPDGSILFCMYHNDYVLIKTDSEGYVVANDDPITPAPVASIVCYPQPANSELMISVKSEQVGELGYSIFNIKGQRIYSGKIYGHSREQSFELPHEALELMSNGVYLISLEQANRRIATTKLVVIK